MTEEVEQAAQPGAEFHVLGVIERKALLRMLQHRVGLCAHSRSMHALPKSRRERRKLLSRFEQRPSKSTSPDTEAGILKCAQSLFWPYLSGVCFLLVICTLQKPAC